MAEAEEPSLIQLLEGLADKNRAPLTPKVAYAPARMKPSGAQAALAVGVRSRSPRRAQSPPSPLRQQSSHGEDGEQLDVPSSLHDERLSFRINNPQRVDPPRDLKAPKRTDNVKPVAQRAAQVAATLAGRTGDDIPETQVKSNRKPGNIASRIKDHTMLAAACRRAGRTRDEGLAYYNIGVLFDNNMEYDKAIKYYEQFVDICKRLGDAKGEALAFNSIGVDYQKLGMHDEAINFHQLHLEVADVPGKFVAHSNLGIAYAAKEENEKASLNHRQALRYAIVMSSLPGESLACGNLGVIGSRKGDATTAKACMERHLKLSGALRDDKAQADAYVQLGQLANTAGEYEDASQYFEMARTGGPQDWGSNHRDSSQVSRRHGFRKPPI